MRVISVHQPWAQLIVDRRRHILIKGWTAKPGELFAIHAAHVRNDVKCKEFGYELEEAPKNAILGVIEVRKCIERDLARPSKFDRSSRVTEGKKLYAIVVRTVEKFRKPIIVKAPRKQAVWECEIT